MWNFQVFVVSLLCMYLFLFLGSRHCDGGAHSGEICPSWELEDPLASQQPSWELEDPLASQQPFTVGLATRW